MFEMEVITVNGIFVAPTIYKFKKPSSGNTADEKLIKYIMGSCSYEVLSDEWLINLKAMTKPYVQNTFPIKYNVHNTALVPHHTIFQGSS
jgi:hypothetical protein